MDLLTSKYLLPSLLSSKPSHLLFFSQPTNSTTCYPKPSHLLLLVWATSAAGSTGSEHSIIWLGEAANVRITRRGSPLIN